jgi:glutamyl-tRNA synthetase
MNSTPKHISIYEAFGWEPPQFGHVSLLVDENSQKLSKRTESTNISELQGMGVFPEALNNFVALLGWSHKNESDVMSMQDLVSNVSTTSAPNDLQVTSCIGEYEIYQGRYSC